MVLIINGPCGVGKSTISNHLENALESCVHISGDAVHCFIVNSEIIPEHVAVTDKNIESLVKNYKEAGFKNIIIDNVYENAAHLTRIKLGLGQYDSNIISVLLYCELQENIRRDANRVLDDICGAERVTYLHNQLYDQGNSLGEIVDVTNISCQEAVNKIKEIISAEPSKLQMSLLEYEYSKMFISGGIKGMHKINTAADYPYYFTKGEGSFIYDLDNNKYIDFVLGKGPYILGYRNPMVEAEVIQQVKQGNVFPVAHPLHSCVAEKMIHAIPSAESVVFYKTGSCAVSAAVRIARAYTNKKLVLSSGYHGWHDWCSTDPGAVNNESLYIDFEYNLNLFDEIIAKSQNQIAAVIITPEEFYFQTDVYAYIESVCKKNNIIFILDEIKSGFRVSYGGFQKKYNLHPDMSTFGKAISNGYALSVLVGKKELLEVSEIIHTAGTYDLEVIPFAAANATLDYLREENVHQKIEAMGNWFVGELSGILKKHAIPLYPFYSCGSFRLWCEEIDVETLFYRRMMEEGVLFYCFDNSYISVAHSSQILSNVLEKTEYVCKAMSVSCGRKFHEFSFEHIKDMSNKKGFLKNYPGVDGRGE